MAWYRRSTAEASLRSEAEAEAGSDDMIAAWNSVDASGMFNATADPMAYGPDAPNPLDIATPAARGRWNAAPPVAANVETGDDVAGVSVLPVLAQAPVAEATIVRDAFAPSTDGDWTTAEIVRGYTDGGVIGSVPLVAAAGPVGLGDWANVTPPTEAPTAAQATASLPGDRSTTPPAPMFAADTTPAVVPERSGYGSTPSGQSAVTPVAPTVSYRYEYQVLGSNTVALYGSYSGPAGTTIEIYSGASDLGTATITGANTWSFNTPALPDGNYSFSAVATTLAGGTATFSGVPSLTVGSATGTLDTSKFTKVWNQDFTTTQINRDIFPIVYGNADQFAYAADGLTLASFRAEGFSNVGIIQPTWDASLGQGYGLYSITASHPANQGAGIAILLWPANNVWPGPELDMVEDWNDPTSQTAYFSVHFKSPLDGSDMADTIQYSVDLTKPNTFALDWEAGSLTYYVNGHELFQITGSEVPKDFAHGGVNAAFGAQVTDIGSNFEPTDSVSLTIHDMSYSVIGPAPASIKVATAGSILQTSPGNGQTVLETITGVSLHSSTVYAIVMNSQNIGYSGWQPVTLDANGVATFSAQYHATGDYLVVVDDPVTQKVSGWSGSVTLGTAANPGAVLSQSVSHDHLWFERSGNDLVVDVLGTTQRAYIDNWYGNGQHWQQIAASDGFKIDAPVDSLVQSMASFAAANPAFNPMTTTHTSLTDSYFGASVTKDATGDWYKDYLTLTLGGAKA